MSFWGILLLLSGFLLAPLLHGVINRTKAVFAGRKGAPLFQQYRDLAKLLRKGAVYSTTTTWVFRIAPTAVLVLIVVAYILMAPAASEFGWGFEGDLILFAYCLGLARFLTVSAALDTGSSFEGMGASREVLYSALAEPALIIGFAVLARVSGSMSLSGIFHGLGASEWYLAGTALVLVIISFLIVMLAENSRIPFDDPNTHLELTMIHEVMVLDCSGPDFALITYGASLKLWLFASLLVNLAILPLGLSGFLQVAVFLAGMFLSGALVGTIESAMARLSLPKAPGLLTGAGVLAVLAFILASRYLN
jgi:formate hydrogenlyase subunit 4